MATGESCVNLFPLLHNSCIFCRSSLGLSSTQFDFELKSIGIHLNRHRSGLQFGNGGKHVRSLSRSEIAIHVHVGTFADRMTNKYLKKSRAMLGPKPVSIAGGPIQPLIVSSRFKRKVVKRLRVGKHGSRNDSIRRSDSSSCTGQGGEFVTGLPVKNR